MKRTKIIATIGPACSNIETLKGMMIAGLNAARLNFSHGTFQSHTTSMTNIRQAASELGFFVPIIQDLSGPKLRLGEFKEKDLEEGEMVKFGSGGIPVQRHIWKWIKKGQTILIDDGLVELIATRVSAVSVEAKVVVAGKLKSNKGVSLPGVKIDLPSLSEKDLEDVEFGVKSGVDYVALSFVKKAEDVLALRKVISKHTDRNVPIIAKIETVDAVKNIESIIKASDAIMIARGDLALNIPQQMVPVYQKKIVRDCIIFGRPVIVATQMLDSMINNPRPTRAEISDVANAVIDRVDCLMLSGETAFGKYPLKVIETMASIISETEKNPLTEFKHSERQISHTKDRDAILAHSLVHIAQHVQAGLVLVNNVQSAESIAHFRPKQRIVLVSKDELQLRQANLIWDVTPVLETDTPAAMLKHQGLVKRGQRYIDASGIELSASIQTVG